MWPIDRKKSARIVSYCVIAGVCLAAFLIVIAPPLPHWDARHAFDANKGSIRLNPDTTIEQTFIPEYTSFNTALFWIKPSNTPANGLLRLTVNNNPAQTTHINIKDVPVSGTVVLQFPKKIKLNAREKNSLTLSLHETRTPVHLLYQIDGSIYPQGELKGRAGDLGFQLRYMRPALGSHAAHWLYAIAVVACGILCASTLRHALAPEKKSKIKWSKKDVTLAALIPIAVATLYGSHLLRSNSWNGPGDFIKDAASLQAGSQAVLQGRWPIWSHLTCGGLPLLGNPESNVMSMGSLFAFFLNGERALRLLLTLEAGIGALGAYILARALKSEKIGATLATAIYSLNGLYSYHIAEGFSMTGASLAFAPWVISGLHAALFKKRIWGGLVSGGAIGLIFLRGEVHILAGLIIVIIFLCMLSCWQQKNWRAIHTLLVIGVTAFLWASPKLLAYLEQPEIFTSNLDTYVVPLIKAKIFDDVFLAPHDRSLMVPVKYGTTETWGNFGAYTGYLPWILGVVALSKRRPYQLWLLGGAALSLLIAEGTIYDRLIRHLGPIGALLRLPNRIFLIYTLFLALLAGQGITVIRSYLPRLISSIATLAVFLAVIANLGSAANTILKRNLNFIQNTSQLAATQPTLARHSIDQEHIQLHPGALLKSNFLLPHLCADLHSHRAYVENLGPLAPLADTPSALSPNVISLHMQGQNQITINENFVSNWVASHGIVVPNPEGNFSLITVNQKTSEVRYLSALAPSQQLLFAVIVIATLTTITLITLAALPGYEKRSPTPGQT